MSHLMEIAWGGEIFFLSGGDSFFFLQLVIIQNKV